MRTKYGSVIHDLLRECRNSKNARPGDTRWDDSLAFLNRSFPSDRDIPIANRPLSTMADDADVWYTTEGDLEKIMDQNFMLSKPTVVRSRRLGHRGKGLEPFLETLNDHFGDGKVDVQDPRTTKSRRLLTCLRRYLPNQRRGGQSGRATSDNLLNLKHLWTSAPPGSYIPQSTATRCPFSLRLEVEFTGRAIAGKRGHAVMAEAREVDLDRSLTFPLFAQRGAFTGFHVDSPDATWA